MSVGDSTVRIQPSRGSHAWDAPRGLGIGSEVDGAQQDGLRVRSKR